VAAIIASPRHGLLVRVLRRRRLARQIAVDDVVAALFRLHERGETSVTIPMLARVVPGRETLEAVGSATALELVALNDGTLTLTSKGLDAGAGIIRRHRLWETWLVDEAGVSPDHVHGTAERLEHLPPEPQSEARIDPHGKNIPSR
ncbi:MAG: iron dependent repressor, metal binding and dimerization domain protein, partial [Planctomycetota bacterium]